MPLLEEEPEEEEEEPDEGVLALGVYWTSVTADVEVLVLVLQPE